MTKKNLRPQQVAPVQRETTGTSSQQGQMTASIKIDLNKITNIAKVAGLATPVGQGLAIGKALGLIK